MARIYKPEWKSIRSQKWMGVGKSFKSRRTAQKFIDRTKIKYKKIGKAGSFRISSVKV